MNCQDFKNQVMDLALGELPVEAERQLDEHAAGCLACSSQLGKAIRVRELLMNGWRDEETPRSLVFTPVAAPSSEGLWSWLVSAPRWVNVSMAAAGAVVLLFATLSLARTDFRYGQGRFALTFGQARPPNAPQATAGAAATTNAALSREEVEKIVTATYAALGAQDRGQYTAMLDDTSKKMQAQREVDLLRIGSAFEQMKTVVWKDMRHNSAMVEYAAQRIGANQKN
jgi:hypothetical protein